MDDEELMMWLLLYHAISEEDKKEKIEEIMDKYWVDEDKAEEILDNEDDW